MLLDTHYDVELERRCNVFVGVFSLFQTPPIYRIGEATSKVLALRDIINQIEVTRT